MAEKRTKALKPAVIFGKDTVKRMGYIDEYIFACEIKGGDHIRYSKPRRPKYHLVIVILSGDIEMIINGEHFHFCKNSYINLPTWADIYEIKYGEDFHAMVTATDRSVVEDIFRNRNPFPPDFRFTIDHSLGGEISNERDVLILQKDISNLIDALSEKGHRFAEEVNYAYFYILLTDMANMMWNRYGTGSPSHHSEMKRSDGILKTFAELVTRNILTEPSLDFYAEQLFLSPKHFSTVIKKVSGKTAGQWIDEYVILEAKTLLKYSAMSIQEVAYYMNFPNPSFFGKYFKHHTGMSPSEYKVQI